MYYLVYIILCTRIIRLANAAEGRLTPLNVGGRVASVSGKYTSSIRTRVQMRFAIT